MGSLERQKNCEKFMKSLDGVKIYNLDLRKRATVKGVLFDMDGIVLDTEKLYTRFWQEAAQYWGYPMTHEMALGMRSLSKEVGERQLKEYLGEGVDYQQVRNKRIEMMNAFIEEHGVETKPGIKELLQFLKDKGIKTAIATSSPLERAEKYLRQVGLLKEFDEIVSGHMVERGKPAPDVYLYAAAKLGLAPDECLVLEDSPTGLLAANRAGCIPVMVPDQDEPDNNTRKLIYAEAENLISVKALL